MNFVGTNSINDCLEAAIDRMVHDAEKCRAEDETNVQKIEAKNGLVKYCLSQRNTFSEEKLKDEIVLVRATKHRHPDPAGQLRALRRLRTQRVRAMLSRAHTDYFRNSWVPCGIGKRNVHEMKLVGGATSCLQVQRMIQELFNGKESCMSISLDDAVGKMAMFF